MIKYDVGQRGWIIDDMRIGDSISELEPFATIIRMLENNEGDEEKLKLVLWDALNAYDAAYHWLCHWNHTKDSLDRGEYQTWKGGKAQIL